MNRRFKALTVGAMALSTPLFANALVGPFQNGSFASSPVVPTGEFYDLDSYPAYTPTAWVATEASPGSYAIFIENDVFGVVGDTGPNAIGFGGNGTTGATISQTFATVVGNTYTVNYDLTGQQGEPNGSESVLVQALDGSTVINSVSDTIKNYPSTLAYQWTAGSTLTFVATSTASTLRFTDTSNGSAAYSTNWALDNVTVNAVPEPESISLGLAGLALTAWVMRRKRSV